MGQQQTSSLAWTCLGSGPMTVRAIGGPIVVSCARATPDVSSTWGDYVPAGRRLAVSHGAKVYAIAASSAATQVRTEAAPAESIYARLRRLSRDARRGNPHLIDLATGLPALLPAANAPTIDTSQTWANAAAVVSAGYSQAFPAATAGVFSRQFICTGGWPIVYSSAYVRLPEVTVYATGNGNAANNPPRSAYSGRISCTTDAPKVVVGSLTGNTARFIIDEKYVALSTTAWPSGAPSFVVLDFSAVGGRALRSITIETIGAFSFHGVWVGPNDSIRFAAQPADALRAVYFGDSISTGSDAAVSGDCFAEVCSDTLGIYDTRRPSIGTTGYGVGSGSLYSAEQHVFDITNQQPDVVFLTHNVNSFNSIPGGWSGTIPYWRSVYDQVRAWSPTVPIFQIGVLNSATPTETNYVTAYSYEVAQSSYVDSLMTGDQDLFYVPVMTDPEGPWIIGTGNSVTPAGNGNRDIFYDQAGPHPNTLGHQHIGHRMARGVLAAIAQAA